MNALSTGFYHYYAEAIAQGLPLFGYGMECHIHLDHLPNLTSVADNMRRFSALGVQIHITELDVSTNNTHGSAAELWEAQGQFFGEFMSVCLNSTGCTAFENWNMVDRYSWVGYLEFNPISLNGGYMFAPDFFGAERYDAKPAVKRVADALRRHGNSVGATMPVAAHGGRDDGHDLPHRHHGRAHGTRDAVHAHVDGESLLVRADQQLLSKHRQLCNAPPSAASIAPQGGVPPMRKYGDDRGIFIGAGVPGLDKLLNSTTSASIDPLYAPLLAEQYSLITAADFYFGVVEPQRGVFDFSSAEQTLAFAEAHNQTVRCHNLLWYKDLPDWLNSTLSNEEIYQIAFNHVSTVVSRVKGRCYAWDVVNEPMNANGTLRTDSIWYKAIGPNYIATVLGWVRDVDPVPLLFLNDYGVAETGPKSDGFYAVFQDLLRQGAPVGGVGFESHFFLAQLPDLASVSQNMARFLALNSTGGTSGKRALELHVTELDVDLEFTSGAIYDRWQLQGDFFREYLNVCLQHAPGCRSFETWNFPDRYTWVGEYDANCTTDGTCTSGYMWAPLPWNAKYDPKPAILGIFQALTNTSDTQASRLELANKANFDLEALTRAVYCRGLVSAAA